MIFIRLVFLILVLMSLNVLAQTHQQTSEQNNKPQAYKFDEYGKIMTKKLEIRLRNFFSEITKSDATGDIVIYAPNEKKINQRVKVVNRFFRLNSVGGFMDKFDISKISFIRVKEENEKTEFWIIPQGAEPPVFEKK